MKILINDWELNIKNELDLKIKIEDDNGQLAPPLSKIYSAFELTKFRDVKVVILGQDPYPRAGDANGLAFSYDEKNKQYLPKSLQNIFKELESDLQILRTNGNLTDWSQQGVFLLNTCLTTTVGVANAHKNYGWEEITFKIVEKIANEKRNVVFILLGKQAQSFVKGIVFEKHLVLTFPHPSPLSAYRGFFGSKIFSKTNIYLIKYNKIPIKW